MMARAYRGCLATFATHKGCRPVAGPIRPAGLSGLAVVGGASDVGHGGGVLSCHSAGRWRLR